MQRRKSRIFDSFLAPVVVGIAGIAGAWHRHRFDWWCRTCEPWPPERWSLLDETSEACLWLDMRGLELSRVTTTVTIDNELVMTIKTEGEERAWTPFF